jgi:hypothetical protein
MLYLINDCVLKKLQKNVCGRRLGGAAGERRPPNAARRKHVPKRSIRRRLEDDLEDVAGDALTFTICVHSV